MSDPLDDFHIDDPHLPKAIKKAALASGGYPYEEKLDWDKYLDTVGDLQRQLVLLQDHMLKSGERIAMVFEGRDAAGKGGAIKTYLQNLNPRYNIHVALPKPNDRESTQWYFQRYVDWLPAAGETALFDRSWYNRAGVEPVMGFCTPEQTEDFLDEAPRFERMLVRDGIHLFKFWLSIGREMQLKRFHNRRHDPLKQWKISDIDISALGKWDSYTDAAHRMLHQTSSEQAPWRVVLNNDKRRGRLELIRTVLKTLEYEGKNSEAVGMVDEKIVVDPERYIEQHGQS